MRWLAAPATVFGGAALLGWMILFWNGPWKFEHRDPPLWMVVPTVAAIALFVVGEIASAVYRWLGK